MTPRILLIGNFLSASRHARPVCEELATRLAARGWPVRTVSSKPARVPRLVDMVHIAWRDRHSYDVAHVDVYSGPAFTWAEAVCAVLRAAGKPYVLTLHGGNLPRFAARWPGRVRRLLRSANVVTAPSRYLFEHFRPVRSDLRLLPNALDLTVYPFRVRERPAPRLVWLRAFHAIYNPALAPAVVARLAAEHPEVQLTMIGADKGDGSLGAARAAAARLNVSDRVTFVSTGVPKEQVPAALDRGDVFINTTNVDNTPVSVLEAMACGLGVVSTAVGGIPYLLDDGVDALLVPPDDADAMARAVARLLTEPGLSAALTRTARAKVDAFDWPVVLAAWEDLLSTVAGEPMVTSARRAG